MKLINVTTDDWEGWYLDGRILAQGHTVDAYDLLQELKYSVIFTLESKELDREWISIEGSLPEHIEDVVFEEE